MDEETLRAFGSVCRLGNITRSAAELHRSQSALSRRIVQLEQEIGTKLLERVPTGVRPTAAGAAFLRHADAALAELTDGRRAAMELVSEDVGPVAVAVVGTLAGSWITDALRVFAARHRQVSIRIETANSNEVVDLVRRGDADIGIGYGRSTESQLSNELLFEEQLHVACAADHPRANTDVGSLTALQDERWFAFTERLPRAETNARHIAGILAVAGVPGENIQTVDSLTAQLRLIEAGFGIALLAASSIQAGIDAERLATIGAGDPPTTQVWMNTRTQALTHAQNSLTERLRTAARLQ